MEKGALKKWFGQFFFGFDRQLGLIFLALATIGFITFLSAGQNTAVRIEDEIRNFVLAFILMRFCSHREL